MRKFLFPFAIILSLATILFSCSKDEEDGPLTDYDASLLLGTWDVTEFKAAPYDGRLSFLIQSSQVAIFQDGIEVEDYWYEREGGVILLTEKGDDEVAAKGEVFSLTESAAKVKITDVKYGYGSYTVKLKKRKLQYL